MHQLEENQSTLIELNEATCWQAVQQRDRRADGAFVFAVTSTGIFCRPSCPARRPRRDRARYFSTPAAATQAGFRPCRRCRPDSSEGNYRQVRRVEKVCRQLEAKGAAGLSLEALSRQAASSPHHLQRTFKQVTGVTPRQYAGAARLAEFKSGVRAGASVTAALYDAGYGSSRGLYENAVTQLGMTPATYRRGGRGASIRFTVVPCALGYLLLAATAKGICAVSLGDTPAALESTLREEFHAAELQHDDEGLAPWAGTLAEHLAGREPLPDLPLDIQATLFQARVWQVLRSIPQGETRTYTQVAAAINQPQAVRAVARACATNAVAVLIPCHRVVRTGGALSGYRWGIERKRQLLKQEADKSPAS